MFSIAFKVELPFEVALRSGPEVVPAKLHRGRCLIFPANQRPTREFDSEPAAISWLESCFGEWDRCDLCLGDRLGPGDTPREDQLTELLAAARDAEPALRIEYRDRVAAHGSRAIQVMQRWLLEPRYAAFAIRVIEHAAPLDPNGAADALRFGAMACAGAHREDAVKALHRVTRSVLLWPRIPLDAGAVGFIGDGPFSPDHLRLLCRDPRRIRIVDGRSFLDWVVVGESADAADIRYLIRQTPRPARFLPQEGWIDFALFGRDWWLDDPVALNTVVDGHAALRVVRGWWPLRWRWPRTEPPGTGDPDDVEFEPESELHRLGYRITDLSPGERWEVLTNAVEVLGLREVATTIASLVKMRKLQHAGRRRYRHAIHEWEFDLARLKSTYYTPSSGFSWPGTGTE